MTTRVITRQDRRKRYSFVLRACLKAIECNQGKPATRPAIVAAYRQLENEDVLAPTASDNAIRNCLAQLARWRYLRLEQHPSGARKTLTVYYGLTKYTRVGAENPVQTPDSYRY